MNEITGRCRNCRYFDRVYADDDWGYCDKAEADFDRCYDEDPHSRKHSDSLAVAEDGSRYVAHLTCHPDFGCVQWEAK